MKIIARSINLNPRTKPQKEDKYKEISDIKKEHKFNIENKVIFVGLVTEYRGQECIITKRNTRKDIDYYKVKFDDDMELKDITVGFLKTPEEYEQWLSDQENDNVDVQNSMSDVERKIIESGKIPMKNLRSCHNQELFFHRDCPSCGYEPVCIYWKKYQYDKVKYN